MQDDAHDIASAAATLLQLIEDSEEDFEWESAPGGDGGTQQTAHTTHSSSTTTHAGPSTQREASRKATRGRHTKEHELVMYLLKKHHTLSAKNFAAVFNHLFRDENDERTINSLKMYWSRYKDECKELFASPTQAELAEHQVWKQKIQDALAVLKLN